MAAVPRFLAIKAAGGVGGCRHGLLLKEFTQLKLAFDACSALLPNIHIHWTRGAVNAIHSGSVSYGAGLLACARRTQALRTSRNLKKFGLAQAWALFSRNSNPATSALSAGGQAGRPILQAAELFPAPAAGPENPYTAALDTSTPPSRNNPRGRSRAHAPLCASTIL